MGIKYRSQASSSEYRFSEPGHFFQSMMSGGHWTLIRQGQLWRPPTDVYETRDSIVVKVEVAGMVEDDFTITFAERTLVIAGVRHDPAAKVGYHQMEIFYGEFRTEVYIPETIDPDSIDASYKDGFLLVVLPKPEFHRPSIGDDE
jgi:HSP20 family protein